MKNQSHFRKLVKIKQFSLLPTTDMYREFDKCRTIVQANQEDVQNYANSKGVIITFGADYTLKNEFAKVWGFMFNFSRLYSTDMQRMFVWYKLKEAIDYYYEISSATITANHIKVCQRLTRYEKVAGFDLQKDFKNGSCLYEPTDEILFLIHLVNSITDNMRGA